MAEVKTEKVLRKLRKESKLYMEKIVESTQIDCNGEKEFSKPLDYAMQFKQYAGRLIKVENENCLNSE